MKFILAFVAAAAFAVAWAAERHTLTLLQPAMVGATELEPGVYKLTISDSEILIERGRTRVSAPVRMETADRKFSSTTVRLRKDEERQNGTGKYRITEIRLGGTNRKLILLGD